MSEPATNRELYFAVSELVDNQTGTPRSLEEFLLALLRRCEACAETNRFSTAEFIELLAHGFTGGTTEFQSQWALDYDKLDPDSGGFPGCRASIIRQIVDLHEMSENGQLDDELRSFGISSPRDSRWYNFDPVAYIQCGLAGAFGGCHDDAEVEALHSMAWEDLSHFIWAGQNYE